MLEADRSGGSFNPLSSATLGEWELPTEHAVSGARTLTITVSPELTLHPLMSHSYGTRSGATAAGRRARCALAARTRPSPKFFQAATQADFLKGEVENLSIDARGQLTLGPATELVYETPAPFLWSIVAGDRRHALRRHRQRGQGVPGRRRRARARCSSTAPSSRCTRWRRRPTAACTSAPRPTARSTRSIATARRRRSSIPTTSTSGRWPSTRSGNVYAGTGEKGVVYKITPDGKGAPFYQTKATHATALAFDKAGNLLVGTESPGRVLRVDADGKGFVLLDSPFQEIRALRFDDKGMLYVAAVNGRAGGGGAAGARPTTERDRPPSDTAARRSPSVSVSTEITVDRRRRRPGRRSTRGSSRDDRRAVERRGLPHRAGRPVGPALGIARRLAVRPRVRRERARSIVATGNKGKIYRLEGDPLRPTLLARASAQQVTAFYKDARGRLYYATANPGKLFRLSPERAAARHVRVRARDAQMVATWGAISWRGTVPDGSKIELSTRSGQHRNAGRHLERVVVAVHDRPTARRSPARRRAISSGARC